MKTQIVMVYRYMKTNFFSFHSFSVIFRFSLALHLIIRSAFVSRKADDFNPTGEPGPYFLVVSRLLFHVLFFLRVTWLFHVL